MKEPRFALRCIRDKYGKIYAVGVDLVEDKEVEIEVITEVKDSKWKFTDETKAIIEEQIKELINKRGE